MIDTNILLIILAVVAVLILAFVIARPRRQKRPPPAARSDEPYVASRDRPYLRAQEGAGVPGEVAAATTDVAGEVLGVEAHDELSRGSGSAGDPLDRLKGVGPK